MGSLRKRASMAFIADNLLETVLSTLIPIRHLPLSFLRREVDLVKVLRQGVSDTAANDVL